MGTIVGVGMALRKARDGSRVIAQESLTFEWNGGA